MGEQGAGYDESDLSSSSASSSVSISEINEPKPQKRERKYRVPVAATKGTSRNNKTGEDDAVYVAVDVDEAAPESARTSDKNISAAGEGLLKDLNAGASTDTDVASDLEEGANSKEDKPPRSSSTGINKTERGRVPLVRARGSDADGDLSSGRTMSVATTVPSGNDNHYGDADDAVDQGIGIDKSQHQKKGCCACVSPSMRIGLIVTAVALIIIAIIAGVVVPLLFPNTKDATIVAGAQEDNATSQEEGGTGIAIGDKDIPVTPPLPSFVYPSNTWESGGTIVKTDDDVVQPGGGSGMTVALSSDGSRMAVGAPFATSPEGHVKAGRITVYKKQEEKADAGEDIDSTWQPFSHFFGAYEEAQLGHVLHLSEDGTMLAVVTLASSNGDTTMCSGQDGNSDTSNSGSTCGAVTTFVFQDQDPEGQDVFLNVLSAGEPLPNPTGPEQEQEQVPGTEQRRRSRSGNHVDRYGRNLRFLQGPSIELLTNAQMEESTFQLVPENAVLNYVSGGGDSSEGGGSSEGDPYDYYNASGTEEISGGGLNLGGLLSFFQNSSGMSNAEDNTVEALGNFLVESALMDGSLSSFLDATVASTLQVVESAANTLGVQLLDASELVTDLSSDMVDVDPVSESNSTSFSILALTGEAMDNLKHSIEQGLKNLEASSNSPGDLKKETQNFVNSMVDATKLAVGHAFTNITSDDFWDDYQASLTQKVTVLVASLNVANGTGTETGTSAGFMGNLTALDFGTDMLVTEYVEFYFDTFLVQLGTGNTTSMSVLSASTAFNSFFSSLNKQAAKFATKMTNQVTGILSFYFMELNQVVSLCDAGLDMSMSGTNNGNLVTASSVHNVLTDAHNLVGGLLASLFGSATGNSHSGESNSENEGNNNNNYQLNNSSDIGDSNNSNLLTEDAGGGDGIDYGYGYDDGYYGDGDGYGGSRSNNGRADISDILGDSYSYADSFGDSYGYGYGYGYGYHDAYGYEYDNRTQSTETTSGTGFDQLSDSATFVETWVPSVLQEASTAYATILFSMLELVGSDLGSGEDKDNGTALAQLVGNVTATGGQMMMPLMGFMTSDAALLLSVFDDLYQELLGLQQHQQNITNNSSDADNINPMCTMAVMELYETTSLLLTDNVTALLTQIETFNEHLMIGVSTLFESQGIAFESKEPQPPSLNATSNGTWPGYYEEEAQPPYLNATSNGTWPGYYEEEAQPPYLNATSNGTWPGYYDGDAVPVASSSTITVSDPRWSPVGGAGADGGQEFSVLGDIPSLTHTVKVGLVTTTSATALDEKNDSSTTNTTTTTVVLAMFVENMATATEGSSINDQATAAVVLQLMNLDLITVGSTTNADNSGAPGVAGVFPVPSTAKMTGFALAGQSFSAAFGTALRNNKYSEIDNLVTVTSFVHIVHFDPLLNQWNDKFYNAPLVVGSDDAFQCGDGAKGGRHFGQILTFSNNGQTLVASVSADTDVELQVDENNDADVDVDCILVFERTLIDADSEAGDITSSWVQKGSTLAGIPSLESLSVSDNGMTFVAILKKNSKNDSTGDGAESVPVQAIVFAFDNSSDDWNATAKIVAAATTTTTTVSSVSLSGDGSLVAVGTPEDDPWGPSSSLPGVTLYAAPGSTTTAPTRK
jgi:hypothetical protein